MRDKEVEHGGSLGIRNYSVTIIVDTCHYTFVPTHRMYKTISSHSANNGLMATMMRQCRFSHYKKCTILVRNIDNR